MFVGRLAIALALASAALACARPDAGARTTSPADSTLVVALTADISSWNPYSIDDATAATVLDLVYPRLFREIWTDAGPRLEPALARSWDFDASGTTLTLRLRDDARWSNGDLVTCEDVAFTLAVQRDERLAWSGAHLKARIAEIACPSAHEATVRFREPYPEALLDLNDDAIVPRAYRAVSIDQWRSTVWESRLVTCGPYRLVGVAPGQEAVLVRDDGYWDAPRTTVGRLVLRIFPDRSQALRQLGAGGLDVLPKVPPQDAAALGTRADARLHDGPSFAYTVVIWNALAPGAYGQDRERRGCDTERGCDETVADLARLGRERPHPLLADARVRRALTLGTDREDIVRGVLYGHAKVAHSPIVSALGEHDRDAALPFDPEAARRLLDDAGFVDADGDGVRERAGVALVLRVLVNADNTVRRDVLERVQASLARIGVRVVIEALPRRELAARARARDFDGLMMGWRAGSRVEPQAILHAQAALDLGPNHGSWWTDASNALLDRASREANPEVRLSLWRLWQRLFRDEQPYLPLYEERSLIGLSSRVASATPTPHDALAGIHLWTIAPSEPRP